MAADFLEEYPNKDFSSKVLQIQNLQHDLENVISRESAVDTVKRSLNTNSL